MFGLRMMKNGHKVCRDAAQTCIFCLFTEKDVFRVLGTAVLNGLFGVHKKGNMCLAARKVC